jgi:hypothetical protein
LHAHLSAWPRDALGDDFWFVSCRAMALSEDGQLGPARAKIERSVAANPKNALGAHGFAHICYENAEVETCLATAPVEKDDK